MKVEQGHPSDERQRYMYDPGGCTFDTKPLTSEARVYQEATNLQDPLPPPEPPSPPSGNISPRSGIVSISCYSHKKANQVTNVNTSSSSLLRRLKKKFSIRKKKEKSDIPSVENSRNQCQEQLEQQT